MKRIILLLKRFKKSFKDPDRKNILSIVFEYTKLRLFKPSISEQYFEKYLFRKNITDFSDYRVTHELNSKLWEINRDNAHLYPLLTNKLFFERYFAGFKINVIKSLAYNEKVLFSFDDTKSKFIFTPKEFLNFLLSLKKRKLDSDSIIIKKMKDSHGGANIYKVSTKEIESDKIMLNKLYKNIISSEFLFQNVLQQHNHMNKLNPNSVNTIRINTFTNRKGESKIISCLLRTGLNEAFIDNMHQGGGAVRVNINSGKLDWELFTDFQFGSGKVFKQHPVSGTSFADFTVPFFEEAKVLAIKAAQLIPDMILVGWDIVIQQNGPIILEGNVRPGIFPAEILEKGFGKNNVFIEMLDEMRF